MAKKPKGRPKTTERNDTSVKIDKGVLAKAKAVAADEGVSLAEFLSETLRPIVDRKLSQLASKLQKGDD